MAKPRYLRASRFKQESIGEGGVAIGVAVAEAEEGGGTQGEEAAAHQSPQKVRPATGAP